MGSQNILPMEQHFKKLDDFFDDGVDIGNSLGQFRENHLHHSGKLSRRFNHIAHAVQSNIQPIFCNRDSDAFYCACCV